jgi:diguanylate cyclase (GGDEF)-like protein
LIEIILAVVLAVIADMLGDWSTVLSEWIVRRAARRLPYTHTARYEEEWLDTLRARPRLMRPFFALDLFIRGAAGIARLERARRAAERTPDGPLEFYAHPFAGRALSRRALRELRREWATDALTGLHNRRYSEDQLKRAMQGADQGQHPICLLYADMDHLKDVNDRYGHETGDDVIQCFAQCLCNSINEAGWIARYGGDEFVIVLPGIETSAAPAVAEKVRADCAAAVMVTRTGKLSVTASFGLAMWDPQCQERRQAHSCAEPTALSIRLKTLEAIGCALRLTSASSLLSITAAYREQSRAAKQVPVATRPLHTHLRTVREDKPIESFTEMCWHRCFNGAASLRLGQRSSQSCSFGPATHEEGILYLSQRAARVPL